ncbi:MAG: RNA methyltransferase [Chloroflexota bacterium]|nr:RNA methyltransferase [Chloroflexota bacterium]
MTLFGRYRPIVGDWAAFQEALRRPLPTCIWTNTLRITPDRLAALLAQAGIQVEPLPWYPSAFKLAPDVLENTQSIARDFRPGRRWEFLAGLYHVQEEVSLLPVVLMDPQPGERVLDLCAAPGNKTAQAAVTMANRGTVVANDRSFLRMRATRQVLERLGLVTVSTVTSNGASFPGEAGLFDRILVDVPCTSEGTSRKKPAILDETGADRFRARSGIQRALLRRAVALCRPGGRIVYSTCTYAPEENEAVVDALLQESMTAEEGPLLRLLPARITGFHSSDGLTEWNGLRFHHSLQHTMRVWPHQNNSGGFFVALLEKEGVPAEPQDMASAMAADEEDSSPWLALLEERFGIPSTAFAGYRVLRRSRDGITVTSGDHQAPDRPKPDATGLFFMRTHMRYPKLTTGAAMLFGPAATRNVIELDEEQVQAYLARQTIAVSEAQSQRCTDTGYVLVRHQDAVLGVGLYFAQGTGMGGHVRSLYPKAWSPFL